MAVFALPLAAQMALIFIASCCVVILHFSQVNATIPRSNFNWIRRRLSSNGNCKCEKIKPDFAVSPELVGSISENDLLKVVFMHIPQLEVMTTNFHPESALFNQPVNWKKARRQLRHLRKTLESEGIKVILLRDVLLDNTEDEDGEPKPSEDLTILQKFAEESLKIEPGPAMEEFQAFKEGSYRLWGHHTKKWSRIEAIFQEMEPKLSYKYQDKYKKKIIFKMTPHQLVNVILNKPTVELHVQNFYNVYNSDLELKLFQRVTVKPLTNLVFTHNTIISQKYGIFLTKQIYQQRILESEILAFVLEKLKIPFKELKDGYSSGGDFIAAGQRAFFGVGPHSSEEAIQEMMRKNQVGAVEVVVVKDYDRRKEGAGGALDMAINLIDDGEILANDALFFDSDQKRLADTYVYRTDHQSLRTGQYTKSEKNASLMDLIKSFDYNLVTPVIESGEGDRNIVNSLNIGQGVIVTSSNHKSFWKRVKEMSHKVKLVNMNAFKEEGVGVRCFVAAIERRPVNETRRSLKY